MRHRQLISLFCVLTIICSCELKRKDNRHIKKEYYTNGRIKSVGYYINDSIPVDTIKYYRTNGHLKFTEVYKNGLLNGVCLYYDSLGVLLGSKEYKDGLLDGEAIEYYPNSIIKSIGRITDSIFIGDVYHYYSNGKPMVYNFLDFKQNAVRIKEYDSLTGKIEVDSGKVLLIDSMKDMGDTLYLKIVLSHPPYTANKLFLEELDDSDKVLRRIYLKDSIPFFTKKILNYHGMNSVRLVCAQYDSLAKVTDSSIYIYKSY